METKDFKTDLVREVIEQFKASGYPSRPLELVGEENLELLIRIPPRAPAFLERKYRDVRVRDAACPSIERIELPESMRNKGLFNRLVNALGSLPGIEAVCVSNVANVAFAQYLANSDEWQELENSFHLLPEPMASIAIQAASAMPSYYRRF